tara:strand:- start:241 stop:783 length:543 start_codon:yes stop_codon:yes gene_type:complete
MPETLKSIAERMYHEKPNREDEEVVDAILDYAASLFSKRETADFLREGVFKMMWPIRSSVKNDIRREAAEKQPGGSLAEAFLDREGNPMPSLEGTSLEGISSRGWRDQVIDFTHVDAMGVSYKVTWGEATVEELYKIAEHYTKISKTYAFKAQQIVKFAKLVESSGRRCLNEMSATEIAI